MIEKLNNCLKWSDRRSKHTVSEKGKTFELENRSKVLVDVVSIDGCVYPKSNIAGKRCDYLMKVDEKKSLYFIELKGTEVIYALKQIKSTVSEIFPFFNTYTCNARIVSSVGVPAINQRSEYRELAKYIFPKGTIEIKNKIKYSEII